MIQWTANPHVHLGFEIAGVLGAAIVYTVSRARRGDTVGEKPRALVIAGAGVGAAIGMRLLFWLSNLNRIRDIAGVFSGKTVVGGLLGGLIGVELVKKLAGIRRSTGDLFVLPLITAMCIGRIGCFLTGPMDLTAGKPTDLPWGIAIADGVKRHPVALYEIAFLLLLIPITRLARREGDAFRIFLSSYLLFRLCVDFLKPEPPPLFAGLSAIQWACVAGLLYYAFVLQKRLTQHDEPNAAIPLL